MLLTKMSYITTTVANTDHLNSMINHGKVLMKESNTGKAMIIMVSECVSLSSETHSLDAIWM